MPLHNRSRSFILKEHKTPSEKIERYRPTQVESLSVQNVSSSPRELIQLASKPLILDQERSKHFIESSLDQGNLIYNQTKSISKQGFGIFTKIFNDLCNGKSQSPLRDALFLGGTLITGGFTLHSLVNTLKSFSPNSQIPSAIGLIKTITGFSLMKSLYHGSINKSFNNETNGRKELKSLSGRAALLTLLWLFENNKLPSKTKDDIGSIANIGKPAMNLAKRVFTGFY
jgi:hypothetical protein